MENYKEVKLKPIYTKWQRLTHKNHLRAMGPIVAASSIVVFIYYKLGLLGPWDMDNVPERTKQESRYWKFKNYRRQGKSKEEAFRLVYKHH
jgi:hypothetical protein